MPYKKASELAKGDVVRIEYGAKGNFFNSTVESIEKFGKRLIVKSYSGRYSTDFVADPEENIELVEGSGDLLVK